MSRGGFKVFVGLILLLALTIGSLTGLCYLFFVAIGVVECDAQPVAIAAVLTVIGLFLASFGWAQVFLLAQRFDRESP